MSPRPGFRVDLSACTGCKACQVACKDKHDLAEGVIWRRVVEVAGGEWVEKGSCWHDETFSYYVSVACNHCERPVCAEVCPTKAMAKGADGIVAVDPDRCMGCRYCEWACPYAAPQFDAAAGMMTKCDLCRDRRAEGRDPACVAACQMRVLSVEDFANGDGTGRETYPMPPAHLTEPSNTLVPHRDVDKAAAADPRIGNEEEI
jgi:anaerobic dimethyl sulfoxide reductase subunit B (iron-sulfur subunit)